MNSNRYRGYKPIEPGVFDGGVETLDLGGWEEKKDVEDNERKDNRDGWNTNNIENNNNFFGESKGVKETIALQAKAVLEGASPWPRSSGSDSSESEEILEFKRIIKKHHQLLSKVKELLL